jgi:6-pyruvoyltetrahydropterin/6-carboxytetrahydropterin synthase
MFHSKKHYPHSLGLSACFRQWKAKSHCRHLHGYALAFTFTFEADSLDDTNWVMDFGNMKPVKEWLVDTFDHRLMLANDDPLSVAMLDLASAGACVIRFVKNTGCEAFAEMAGAFCQTYLRECGAWPRVRLASVWCSEHEGNGAGWSPK